MNGFDWGALKFAPKSVWSRISIRTWIKNILSCFYFRYFPWLFILWIFFTQIIFLITFLLPGKPYEHTSIILIVLCEVVCVCMEKGVRSRWRWKPLNVTFCAHECFMFSEKMLSTLNKIRKDWCISVCASERVLNEDSIRARLRHHRNSGSKFSKFCEITRTLWQTSTSLYMFLYTIMKWDSQVNYQVILKSLNSSSIYM